MAEDKKKKKERSAPSSGWFMSGRSESGKEARKAAGMQTDKDKKKTHKVSNNKKDNK